MKITSFQPMIVSNAADDVIAFFEALGFEKKHAPVVESGGVEIVDTSMANPDGFKVDVAQTVNLPRDMTIIRMNVDDFDEAYELLKSKGFKNSKGADEFVETPHNKSCMMISPSGFAFDLCTHIK